MSRQARRGASAHRNHERLPCLTTSRCCSSDGMFEGHRDRRTPESSMPPNLPRLAVQFDGRFQYWDSNLRASNTVKTCSRMSPMMSSLILGVCRNCYAMINCRHVHWYATLWHEASSKQALSLLPILCRPELMAVALLANVHRTGMESDRVMQSGAW